MQDWENFNSNNTDGNSDDTFSWESEKAEAIKNYKDYIPDAAYKYEPKPSRAVSRDRSDSIFYSDSSRQRRPNYSQGGFGQVRYDYPGEDDSFGKYSPKGTYDDSFFLNTSGDSIRKTAQKKSGQQTRNPQQSKKTQGTKQAAVSKHKKKKKGGSSRNTNSRKAQANQSRASGGQQPTRKPSQHKSGGRPIDKKQQQRMREREQKSEANRRKRVQRSNNDYINRTEKGESRDEIRKKRSKRRRRTGKFYAMLSVTVLIVCAISAIFIYCYVHGMPIETVNIEGLSDIYSQEQVLKVGEIVKGENIFRIRKGKAAKNITKQLPYIKSVDIKLRLPSTVNLTINETDEKYLIANGSNYICVDANDKVVSDKKKKIKSGKYKIEGFDKQTYEVGNVFEPTEKNKEKYQIVKQIVDAIEKTGLKNCTVINLSKLNEICITCDNRIKIYVESDTDFERRLKLAQMTIESKVKSGGKYYIDLRYSDMAVLKDGELN